MSRLCSGGVEYVPLGTVCDITKGEQINKINVCKNGTYPVINGGTKPTGYIEQYNQEADTITVAQGGVVGFVNWINCRFWAGAHCFVLKPREGIMNRFLYHLLKSREPQIQALGYGTTILMMKRNDLINFVVPVPPMKVQAEIVRILDNFTGYIALLTHELDLRKKQYAYYCEKLLTFGDDVRRITLGEIGKVCMCKRILKHQTQPDGEIPFYKIGTFGGQPDTYISRDLFERLKNNYPYPKKGHVLISAAGTIGKLVIFNGDDAYFQDSNIVWIDNDESQVLNKFLYYVYHSEPWEITKGGTIKRLYNDNIAKAIIPVPPLETQHRISEILGRFETLCSDLTHGLPAEISARRKQYEYYRDKLLAFTPKS